MKELRGTPNSRTPPTSSLVGYHSISRRETSWLCFRNTVRSSTSTWSGTRRPGSPGDLPSSQGYEDQRSTVLAVDNLNGAKVLGRTIKVEHVEDYRLKDEEAAKKKIGSAVVGQRTLSSGTTASNVEVLAHHSRSRRTTETILQESMLDLPRKDGDTMGFERTRRAPPRVNLRRGRVRYPRQLPTWMMMMQSSENLKHAKRLQEGKGCRTGFAHSR